MLLSRPGFGEVGLATSFWLGLEPLHQLTTIGGYGRMRVEMYANGSAWYSAEYDQFSVDNETNEYRLSVSGYSGDAGDQLWPNNGQPFSTSDHGMMSPTALAMQGGWWYSGYDLANVNGGFEFTVMSPTTGFYWNCSMIPSPPPTLSSLVAIKPGRLLISRVMITQP